MRVLKYNGFIVKRIDSEFSLKYDTYRGIEGDTWPIDSYSDIKERSQLTKITDYLDHNVFQSMYDNDYVDLCNDVNFINSYIELCLNLDYKIEVLLCETEKSQPQICNSIENKDDFLFLGYDYAYREPSYYSCVYHDTKRFDEMSKLKLNQYKLFSDIESLEAFISSRNELVGKYPPNMFERGEFIVYKIWSYVGQYPIKE